MIRLSRPMKAEHVDFKDVQFPCYASPKLDGVRCLIDRSCPYTKTLKKFPNEGVNAYFGREELNGFDGELIVGNPTDPNVCNKTMSAVMSRAGFQDVKFYVFDYWMSDGEFRLRHDELVRQIKKLRDDRVVLVPQKLIKNMDELLAFETEMLALGYEGVCIRVPHGLYKMGRSTVKQGWLLKIKRFLDSEAVITGVVEEMHNANEAKIQADGSSKRSSHKENKHGKDTLGVLEVRDLKTGVEFEIGIFKNVSAAQKKAMWDKRDKLIGLVVKYQYFPVGVKDRPRHPKFIGFRDARDVD